MRTEGTSRGALLAVVLVLAGCHGASREVELGRALFSGARPLPAHLAGQDVELPPEVVRCASCHDRQPSGPGAGGPSARGLSDTFGPPLTRVTLTRALARRGGPPSTYDVTRLCRAMRDGVDPTLVVIPQTMPRYAVSDDECRALWAFLSTRS